MYLEHVVTPKVCNSNSVQLVVVCLVEHIIQVFETIAAYPYYVHIRICVRVCLIIY